MTSEQFFKLVLTGVVFAVSLKYAAAVALVMAIYVTFLIMR